MTSFLTSSFCQGHRPKRWMNIALKSRPDLLAKLMRERTVARFVVAPSGYGKTFLLLEYCQVVNDFYHTMWLDARSPCFLRDLDNGTIVEAIMRRDEEMRVVVFDDLPHLSTERADEVSHAIDALLDAGVEVLVSCRPSCDAYHGRQKDRLCLFARDLMLSDQELQESGVDVASGASDEDSPALGGERGAKALLALRIPQVVWAIHDGSMHFARDIAKEELPGEVVATQFMIMALGEASLSWACEQCGQSASRVLALRYAYPHLGISMENDSFSSVVLDADELSVAFSPKLEEVAASFSCVTADEVCVVLANALMANGSCERACQLMAAMASKPTRAAWILDNGKALFEGLCIEPAWLLGTTLYKLKADTGGSQVEVQQAWRTYLMGDAREALKVATKVAARPQAPTSARAWALLLIAHLDKGQLRTGALDRLSLLVPAWDAYRVGGDEMCEPWELLGMCLLARSQAERSQAKDPSEREVMERKLGSMWVEASVACPSASMAFLGGALLLDLCPELARNDVFCCLAEAAGENLSAAYLEAFRVLADIAGQGGVAAGYADALMTEDVVEALRLAERRLVVQKREYSRVMRVEERRRSARSDAMRGYTYEEEETGYIPRLNVSLFGGITVEKSGRTLGSEEFTMSKMRAMFTLLVMEGGREVSRDRLIEALWPASAPRTARKNLYSNWAALVRVLSLPDGTCPYLRRVQGSYRIDGRYVTSDVGEVASICRTLALDNVDPKRFRNMLDELNRLYCGELLPAETKIDVIVEARERYRDMVTDALVQATLRLLEMGDNQLALWSARTALQHNKTQEEPFFAMMSAQAACGQREAALMTYRQCVSSLNKLYRVDPSYRMVSLYRRCTEVEEVF